MRAGSLKDFIIIEEGKKTKDAYRETVNTYEKFAEAKCQVSHITSNEKYFTGIYADKIVKKFRLRYISGVKSDMRILFDGEVFDIKEVVDPTRKKRELLIVGEFVK